MMFMCRVSPGVMRIQIICPCISSPRGKPPHIEISRKDYLEFEGVLGEGTVKPFCPVQAEMDSAQPFVIYLDYISNDLTGTEIDHARIRLPQ